MKVKLTISSHNGIATDYYQYGVAGSCGEVHSDSSMIVAISPYWWSRHNYCGRRIKMTNTGPITDHSIGGKGNVVIVTVADTCSGCAEGHLDLSKGAWSTLTNNAADSQVGIRW